MTLGARLLEGASVRLLHSRAVASRAAITAATITATTSSADHRLTVAYASRPPPTIRTTTAAIAPTISVAATGHQRQLVTAVTP